MKEPTCTKWRIVSLYDVEDRLKPTATENGQGQFRYLYIFQTETCSFGNACIFVFTASYDEFWWPLSTSGSPRTVRNVGLGIADTYATALGGCKRGIQV